MATNARRQALVLPTHNIGHDAATPMQKPSHHRRGVVVGSFFLSTALASRGVHGQGGSMFAITEADAVAIRAIFNEEGELSAAIELRRRFPGVIDNAKARACARAIAGWTPLPAQPSTVTQLRPRKGA